jgi:hypothetical protein
MVRPRRTQGRATLIEIARILVNADRGSGGVFVLPGDRKLRVQIRPVFRESAMLAVAAKLAKGNLLANLSAVGFCDIGWRKWRANCVAGGKSVAKLVLGDTKRKSLTFKELE